MRLEPPAWWYGGRIPLAAWGLLPVSILYGKAVQARFMAAAPYRSSLPIICVGNFTVGGAGKTPVALKLASLLGAQGLRPSFLTRGFGGREKGPHVVKDGDTATQVGDEAILLAKVADTVVSKNRPDGAKLLEKLETDAVIMDDGFQNPSLEKDFSLIVVDGGAGIGSGRVFPLGPLRGPLAFQAQKADAILVLGTGEAKQRFGAQFMGKPVFYAEAAPVSPPEFKGPQIAFCGIGRPSKFYETLEQVGVEIVKFMSFPDHHPYSEKDAFNLLSEAEKAGAGLVTTEKDYARLQGRGAAFALLAAAVVPLPISIRFHGDDETKLMSLIRSILANKRQVKTGSR